MLHWKFELTFTEDLLGSAPVNPEIYTKFIESRREKRNDALAKVEDREVDTIPREVDERQGYTGFHRDEKGIFLYDYAIKGFFKEASNILKEQLKITNLRSKMDNLFFVFPRRIHILGDNGSNLLEQEDILERPLRAMTMQGPRVSLAKSDVVKAGRKIQFEAKMIESKDIKNPDQVIEECLNYGGLKGLGQWRNGSYGRFTASWEPVLPEAVRIAVPSVT